LYPPDPIHRPGTTRSTLFLSLSPQPKMATQNERAAGATPLRLQRERHSLILQTRSSARMMLWHVCMLVCVAILHFPSTVSAFLVIVGSVTTENARFLLDIGLTPELMGQTVSYTLTRKHSPVSRGSVTLGDAPSPVVLSGLSAHTQYQLSFEFPEGLVVA
jgi:hypothetical protein